MVRKQPVDLADFVREAMKKHGITVRDVEARSGGRITNSYVTKIVNRTTRNLSLDKLQALAVGLGVNEDELFAVARGVQEPAGLRESHIWDLFEVYQRLELDSDRQIFDHIIEGVLRTARKMPKKKADSRPLEAVRKAKLK